MCTPFTCKILSSLTKPQAAFAFPSHIDPYQVSCEVSTYTTGSSSAWQIKDFLLLAFTLKSKLHSLFLPREWTAKIVTHAKSFQGQVMLQAVVYSSTIQLQWFYDSFFSHAVHSEVIKLIRNNCWTKQQWRIFVSS